MRECIILHRKRRVVLIPESHTEPLPVRESDHRVLSLHRETPPDDRATTEASPEAPGHGRKEKEKRAKVRRRAARLQLLHDHWPALFAVTRPLKVGIKDDLIQDAQQRQLGLKPNDFHAIHDGQIHCCDSCWVSSEREHPVSSHSTFRFWYSGITSPLATPTTT